MIVCNIEDLGRLESLHPLFKTLFDYVKNHDLLKTPLGRIELQGNDLFINNSEPLCVKAEEQVLEIHRQYIDVHVLLEGSETIGWKALGEIQHICKAYDEAADYELSDDRSTTFVTLHPGQCLIAFPEDPHAPIIGEGKIRKAIGKVRL